MKLHECPVRERLKLTSVDCHEAHALRLGELGLRAGMETVITQKAAFGGLVLNISGSRLAVDHASARSIDAEVLR